MTESGNYPPGAEFSPDAPWNKVDNPEKEIEVTVSITLSKTVKIKVSDYSIIASEKDEDGNYYEDIDYSNCNLKGAVEEQLYLPQDAGRLIDCFELFPFKAKRISEDLSDWCVDDFEVVKE